MKPYIVITATDQFSNGSIATTSGRGMVAFFDAIQRLPMQPNMDKFVFDYRQVVPIKMGAYFEDSSPAVISRRMKTKASAVATQQVDFDSIASNQTLRPTGWSSYFDSTKRKSQAPRFPYDFWQPNAKFIFTGPPAFFDGMIRLPQVLEDSASNYPVIPTPTSGAPEGFFDGVVTYNKPVGASDLVPTPAQVQISYAQGFFTDIIKLPAKFKPHFSSDVLPPNLVNDFVVSFFDSLVYGYQLADSGKIVVTPVTSASTNFVQSYFTDQFPKLPKPKINFSSEIFKTTVSNTANFAQGFFTDQFFKLPKLKINFSSEILLPQATSAVPEGFFDGIVSYVKQTGTQTASPLAPVSTFSQALPGGMFDGISVRYNVAEDATFYPLQPITQVVATGTFGWAVPSPQLTRTMTVGGSESEIPKVDTPTWGWELMQNAISRYGVNVSGTLTEAPKVDNPTWGWEYAFDYKFIKPYNVARQEFTTLTAKIVQIVTPAQWFWGVGKEIFYKNPRITHDFQLHSPLVTTQAIGVPEGMFDAVINYSRPTGTWSTPALTVQQQVTLVPGVSFDGIFVQPRVSDDGASSPLFTQAASNHGWAIQQEVKFSKPSVARHKFSFFQPEGFIRTTFPDGWAGYQWNYQLKKPYPPLDPPVAGNWVFTPPPPGAALNWGFGGYQFDYKVKMPQFPITSQQFSYFQPQGPIAVGGNPLNLHFHVHMGRLWTRFG